MQSPHRHACVGSLCRFQDTAECIPAESLKTGRCASVKQHCGNGKRRRRASNLPANNFQNQYNSKCSWMQAADLMPLSVWTVAIFCHRKNFQNRLFKMRFSVGLNRRTFQNVNAEAMRKHFVNICEKGSKTCVLTAYHMRGLFQNGTNRQRRHKSVNDLWIFSKWLLKIAFPWPIQWGDFFEGTPLKTQKSVGSNREGYWWT